MANQPRERTAETLGANVRYLREHASISQTELARRMTERGWPWHQSTVYRVESGRQAVRFDEAVDLADLLGATLDRMTWAIGEAAEQELAEGALTRLKDAHVDAIQAIVQLHVARAAAERAARDAARSEYAHVREAAVPIAEGLLATMIERVVSAGELEWERMAKELDGDQAGEASRKDGLWRGDLGRHAYFWEGIFAGAYGTEYGPVGELLSTVRQTKEGRAGLAELDRKRRQMMAADLATPEMPQHRRQEQGQLVRIGRELFGERGPATQEQVDRVVARAQARGIKSTPWVMNRLADEELEIVDPAEAGSTEPADDRDGA
jgi:transcriptional regulator with XRE-family HTH domain